MESKHVDKEINLAVFLIEPLFVIAPYLASGILTN